MELGAALMMMILECGWNEEHGSNRLQADSKGGASSQLSCDEKQQQQQQQQQQRRRRRRWIPKRPHSQPAPVSTIIDSEPKSP